VRAVAILCATLVLSCGGASKPGTPLAPLPAVSLPDLSRTEKGVQQQLGEQYRSLTSKIANRNTTPAELSDAYGQMGNLLLAADYFDAAEACYLHAQSLAPDDVRWPYYLGHVYMARPDLGKAVASFERTLRLRPDDVASLVWLGGVHLDLGEPELAEPLFAKALSLQPAAVSAMFGLGRAALAKRDFRAAIGRFEQALSADPRATIVHYPLALAYRGVGDTAKAEEHLRQRGSVEVGPPDPLMVQLRGLIRSGISEENEGIRALDAGDFGKAAEHFRRGIELAPDSPSLHHKLGTALSLSGDTRAAAAQFEEAIRLSPGFAQSHYSLGLLLAAAGQYREAADRFATAVRYEPNYVDARLRLGEMLQRTGRPDAALAQYTRVIEIDPRVAEARFGYATSLAQLGRFEEARKRLAEGAALYPERREFNDALARLPGGRKE